MKLTEQDVQKLRDGVLWADSTAFTIGGEPYGDFLEDLADRIQALLDLVEAA